VEARQAILARHCATKTTYVTGAISGFRQRDRQRGALRVDSATVTSRGAQGRLGNSSRRGGSPRAEVDAQGNAHAKAIDQERLAQGVVQAVDLAAGTLTVAGQLIRVDNETMWTLIPGGSLAGMRRRSHRGARLASASGEARATRIETADAGDAEVELTLQ